MVSMLDEQTEADGMGMDEEQEGAQEAPPAELAITPTKRKRNRIYKEEEFVQSLNVRVGSAMEPLAIPVDGQNNAQANMVVAAKLRGLYMKSVEAYAASDDTMTPKELKDVMDAGRALIEITGMPYSGTPVGQLPNSSQSNHMGGIIAGMAAGMGVMAGMAAGGEKKSLSDVLAQIDKIGKKKGGGKSPMQVVEATVAATPEKEK